VAIVMSGSARCATCATPGPHSCASARQAGHPLRLIAEAPSEAFTSQRKRDTLLTADLVHARRRGDRLVVVPCPKGTSRAGTGHAYLDLRALMRSASREYVGRLPRHRRGTAEHAWPAGCRNWCSTAANLKRTRLRSWGIATRASSPAPLPRARRPSTRPCIRGCAGWVAPTSRVQRHHRTRPLC